jgi:hypothetical protein
MMVYVYSCNIAWPGPAACFATLVSRWCTSLGSMSSMGCLTRLTAAPAAAVAAADHQRVHAWRCTSADGGKGGRQPHHRCAGVFGVMQQGFASVFEVQAAVTWLAASSGLYSRCHCHPQSSRKFCSFVSLLSSSTLRFMLLPHSCLIWLATYLTVVFCCFCR